jgi:hypothetical protein
VIPFKTPPLPGPETTKQIHWDLIFYLTLDELVADLSARKSGWYVLEAAPHNGMLRIIWWRFKEKI